MLRAKILLAALLYGSIANAQLDVEDSTKNMYEMTLEDFLNFEVEVASQSAINTLEAPGILTIITQEEIQQTGARDLIDVLRLVPGLNFHVDVQSVVGISARGNWGHEGKILLLLDGQEMNETLYACTEFGNHFDVNQIQKIEIIRGPGSSIYGGYAELGVINIITKNGKQMNGVSASATYGQLADDMGRANVSLGVGKQFKDFEFSLAGFMGQAKRSTQLYTDLYGTQQDMRNNSDLKPTNVNLGMKYKTLELRIIHDDYKSLSVDWYDESYPEPFEVRFLTDAATLKYAWKIGEKFTLTPKISYKKQLPWSTINEVRANNTQKYTTRLVSNLTANYDINEDASVTVGFENTKDAAEDFSKWEENVFSNGKKTIDFSTMSAYVRSFVKTDYVNFVLGGRIDNHSQYGTAYSPRLGVTKRFEKFHYKALFSKAFRAPSIANINLNNNITPERTTVLEAEFGYKLNSKMIITANVFDITINGPIVYFYDEANDIEGYKNYDKSGSQGIEITYLIRDTWGFINLNYSFSSANGKNLVPDYEVPGMANMLLGMPQHKINLFGGYNFTTKFSVGPSLTFNSTRYGYNRVNDDGESVINKYGPDLLANIMFNYRIKSLTTGLGVYDILNSNPFYLQPYNGYHAPFPAAGREIILKLTYNFNFHKDTDTIE